MRKGEIQARNTELERDNAALQQQVEELRRQLEIAELSGTVAGAATVEIDRLIEDGVIDNEALSQATANVVQDERNRLVRQERNRLEANARDEIVERVRETEGPEIRERIQRELKQDGTITQLEREARGQVEDELRPGVLEEARTKVDEAYADPAMRAEIRAEITTEVDGSDEIARLRDTKRAAIEDEERDSVVAELEAGVDAEFDDPEVRARIRDELREALRDSDDLRDYRDSLLRQRRAELRDPVEEELRADIARSIIADEPAIRARLRQQLEASDDIAEYRRTKIAQFEREVRNMTDDEIRAEIDDQELETLVRKRADAMKEELRREQVARELNDAFTRGDGIDVREIEKDTTVEIYLGEVEDLGEYEFTEPNPNGNGDRRVNRSSAFYRRKLTLSSLGNGKFVVNGDSFFSQNVDRHEANARILSGTIIAIGRQEKDGQEISLAPALFADVPLWYDVDTTDDKIKCALYPVQDVVISGVSARGLEHLDIRTIDKTKRS